MPNRTLNELQPIYKALRQLLLIQYYCLRTSEESTSERKQLAELFTAKRSKSPGKRRRRAANNDVVESEMKKKEDTSFIPHLMDVVRDSFKTNVDVLNDLYDVMLMEFVQHSENNKIEHFMLPLLQECFETDKTYFPISGDVAIGEYFRQLHPFWFLFSGKLKQRGIDFSSLNEGIYVYIRKATNGEIDLAKEHGHEIDAIRGLIKIYRSQKNMICPVYTNYYAGLAMDAETGTYKRLLAVWSGWRPGSRREAHSCPSISWQREMLTARAL